MSRSYTPAHAEGRPELIDLTKEFDRILAEAAAEIKREWFKLPMSGRDAVYRERVYCYELYHQMRCRWPKGSRWRLNGEVDKLNHPDFEDCAPKPDLLVHVPGGPLNYAVIEVKSCSGAKKERIEEDIKKLVRFTQRIKSVYDRAIYLIFGRDNRRVAEDVWEILQNYGQEAARVEFWVHSRVGEQAVRIGSTESGSDLSG